SALSPLLLLSAFFLLIQLSSVATPTALRLLSPHPAQLCRHSYCSPPSFSSSSSALSPLLLLSALLLLIKGLQVKWDRRSSTLDTSAPASPTPPVTVSTSRISKHTIESLRRRPTS
ncbi:hypothetical protein A4X13_0g7599, partial [Tilletia indica]